MWRLRSCPIHFYAYTVTEAAACNQLSDLLSWKVSPQPPEALNSGYWGTRDSTTGVSKIYAWASRRGMPVCLCIKNSYCQIWSLIGGWKLTKNTFITTDNLCYVASKNAQRLLCNRKYFEASRRVCPLVRSRNQRLHASPNRPIPGQVKQKESNILQ